ncbi:enterotoxin [Silvibacterium dinghuense]|uniref:Enterotoxin n=1 Tax=Silvibacterium dinghuense TaxID=1560006 RepID=A0A4Q1SAV3_9BACT|nr:enterotoxin [Silvibacterium dinghuense]RXS94278.1 enterotoxin [Silvibacterium dinghuense]GGH17236.1 enterotoxin [Silvibacterium dinghuense]
MAEPSRYSIYVAILLLAGGSAAWAAGPQPVFGNRVVSANVQNDGGRLRLGVLEDRSTHAQLPLGEAFVLVLQDGREVPASSMKMEGGFTESVLEASPEAARAAEHLPGRELCAELKDEGSGAMVHWCMIARGDAPYLRQEITIHAGGRSLPLADVEMLHFHDDEAKVVGSVAGSPMISGEFFRGFEHPLSYSEVKDGEAVAGLKRTLPLDAGQSITYSSVAGVTHPGQMRRDFLAYIELERAHPYRTFLHYNTWYDLGFGERFGADGVLNRMHAFGEELVRKRGVVMDSFLMDDGWDNTSSLWGFDSGFPDGFAPLRATAKQYGFGIGVWLSPWGGYDKEKSERIAYGKREGYEIVKDGYALSGPKYYAKFEEACLNFISQYGVNQFKFDGTGNANQVFPGSVFDSDFSAAIHLIDRLRKQESNLFINLTTGTKPSPFWLRYADTIWRSGMDNSFAGEGSWRQRWITYRDGQTYQNIVQAGPLFPLNSLMLHGLIYAREAEHLSDDPGHDFADEVHSYFGSGTQLQEMYITPSLLSSADWDVLAESARWSRANAAILRDTHWVGGNPLHGEVYGWASWSKHGGILVLRNPSSHAASFPVDIGKAFELPGDAASRYVAHSPWKADAAQPAVELQSGDPHTFTLKPFEVLTLQATPRS